MLSFKCPRCGATVHYEDNQIVSFCSFCGAHFDDMSDIVKRSAEVEMKHRENAARKEEMNDTIKVLRKYAILFIIVLAAPFILFWLIGLKNHIY